MLFRLPTLELIAAGKVTMAVRKWKRPTVKTGGTLVTRVGVLAIQSVERVTLKSLTARDAKAAGYDDLAKLKAELAKRKEGSVYKVKFKLAGADPRIALRQQAKLTAADRAEITQKLDRMDRASRTGPWTKQYLQLIAKHPATLAATLAKKAGTDKATFKPRVRRLKALGLTESLEVGYRLSPRGKAVLKNAC